MYFSLVMLVFGSGFAYSSVPLLLWGLVVTMWFSFFQIPFEEKELTALFGESYVDCRRQVPMLFPYGKRYKQ
jgi:protein-S-isoprenylcysteine O-methyltransferase Ste14